MIAAGGPLREGHAAELGGPDDERVVEHAALLQIAQQCGDRLVDRAGDEGQLVGDVGVVVPVLASGPPMPLQTCTKRTPRSSSRRAVRQLRPKAAVDFVVEAVELLRRLAFRSRKIERLGCAQSASSPPARRCDAGFEPRVARRAAARCSRFSCSSSLQAVRLALPAVTCVADAGGCKIGDGNRRGSA